jgi:hypothetical protein
MKIIKIKDPGVYEGIPDYYSVYCKYLKAFKHTKDSKMMEHALHYALVAEEMGQVIIETPDFRRKK